MHLHTHIHIYIQKVYLYSPLTLLLWCILIFFLYCVLFYFYFLKYWLWGCILLISWLSDAGWKPLVCLLICLLTLWHLTVLAVEKDKENYEIKIRTLSVVRKWLISKDKALGPRDREREDIQRKGDVRRGVPNTISPFSYCVFNPMHTYLSAGLCILPEPNKGSRLTLKSLLGLHEELTFIKHPTGMCYGCCGCPAHIPLPAICIDH